MLETITAWDRPLYVGSVALLALAKSEPETCAAAFGGDVGAQRKLAGTHARERSNFPHGINHLTAERFGASVASRMG